MEYTFSNYTRVYNNNNNHRSTLEDARRGRYRRGKVDIPFDSILRINLLADGDASSILLMEVKKPPVLSQGDQFWDNDRRKRAGCAWAKGMDDLHLADAANKFRFHVASIGNAPAKVEKELQPLLSNRNRVNLSPEFDLSQIPPISEQYFPGLPRESLEQSAKKRRMQQQQNNALLNPLRPFVTSMPQETDMHHENGSNLIPRGSLRDAANSYLNLGPVPPTPLSQRGLMGHDPLDGSQPHSHLSPQHHSQHHHPSSHHGIGHPGRDGMSPSNTPGMGPGNSSTPGMYMRFIRNFASPERPTDRYNESGGSNHGLDDMDKFSHYRKHRSPHHSEHDHPHMIPDKDPGSSFFDTAEDYMHPDDHHHHMMVHRQSEIEYPRDFSSHRNSLQSQSQHHNMHSPPPPPPPLSSHQPGMGSSNYLDMNNENAQGSGNATVDDADVLLSMEGLTPNDAMQALEYLSVVELKNQLRLRSLPKSGRKFELIRRLLDFEFQLPMQPGRMRETAMHPNDHPMLASQTGMGRPDPASSYMGMSPPSAVARGAMHENTHSSEGIPSHVDSTSGAPRSQSRGGAGLGDTSLRGYPMDDMFAPGIVHGNASDAAGGGTGLDSRDIALRERDPLSKPSPSRNLTRMEATVTTMPRMEAAPSTGRHTQTFTFSMPPSLYAVQQQQQPGAAGVVGVAPSGHQNQSSPGLDVQPAKRVKSSESDDGTGASGNLGIGTNNEEMGALNSLHRGSSSSSSASAHRNNVATSPIGSGGPQTLDKNMTDNGNTVDSPGNGIDNKQPDEEVTLTLRPQLRRVEMHGFQNLSHMPDVVESFTEYFDVLHRSTDWVNEAICEHCVLLVNKVKLVFRLHAHNHLFDYPGNSGERCFVCDQHAEVYDLSERNSFFKWLSETFQFKPRLAALSSHTWDSKVESNEENRMRLCPNGHVTFMFVEKRDPQGLSPDSETNCKTQ